MTSNRIIDCFIFYNELELLKYRMEVIGPYVDWFILVESKYTFSGEPKPLYYIESLEKDDILQKWKYKTLHIIITNIPFIAPLKDINNAWKNEVFQRNSIQTGLDIINYSGDNEI